MFRARIASALRTCRCREPPLQASTAFWHILNFFGPALGVGLLAPLLAKLLWRGALKKASWWRLSAWVGVASALVSIAGLVVFRRDGVMATYAAMVVISGLMLWWRGFVRTPR